MKYKIGDILVFHSKDWLEKNCIEIESEDYDNKIYYKNTNPKTKFSLVYPDFGTIFEVLEIGVKEESYTGMFYNINSNGTFIQTKETINKIYFVEDWMFEGTYEEIKKKNLTEFIGK